MTIRCPFSRRGIVSYRSGLFDALLAWCRSVRIADLNGFVLS